MGKNLFNKFSQYNVVAFPVYRYATFTCNDRYQNINFDEILQQLGKFYFKQPELGLNAVCSLIRDEINKEWHLNSFKRKIRMKRVSTNQIKTIRRSFLKIHNHNENFIRIPFDVVSILFFIIQLVNRIDDENASIEQIKRELNDVNIGSYLYRYHAQVFEDQYDNVRRDKVRQESRVLFEKYERLQARLTSNQSIMKKKYKEVDWNNASDYVIK